MLLGAHYIQQDKDDTQAVSVNGEPAKAQRKLTFAECFKFKQTWAFAFGKFATDGVWWFFLFWTPAYLSSVYGMKSSDFESQLALFVLYAITLLSIIGGWLPTYFVDKKGMNPMQAVCALCLSLHFPLLALAAQPLGHISYWCQWSSSVLQVQPTKAWSANIFNRRWYVPQIGCCYHYRHWRYGGVVLVLSLSIKDRVFIWPCRNNQHEIHRLQKVLSRAISLSSLSVRWLTSLDGS